MAQPAARLRMCTLQLKICFPVIKIREWADRIPTHGSVAVGTSDLEIAMRASSPALLKKRQGTAGSRDQGKDQDIQDPLGREK
jgi:hypothetical protein